MNRNRQKYLLQTTWGELSLFMLSEENQGSCPSRVHGRVLTMYINFETHLPKGIYCRIPGKELVFYMKWGKQDPECESGMG